MIAYFALLSFVPLLFLSLALLGTAHQADASSFFVRELQRTFPSTLARLDPRRRARDPRERDRARASSAARSCSGRRSRSSACSRARSTSSTTARTARFLRGKALATHDDGLLAGLPLRRRSSSARSGVEFLQALRGLQRQRRRRLRASRSASRSLGVFVFLDLGLLVLTNVDADAARGAARARSSPRSRSRRRSRSCRCSCALEAQPGAADALRPGGAARLALRDGERDRARRRGQLAPPLRRRELSRRAQQIACRERLRRLRAVGVRALPVVAELGDRLLVAGGDEDRVVAEAARRRAARGRSSPSSTPTPRTPRPPARSRRAR